MERTLVLIKPDGIQRNLVGTIISKLEQRGLKLVAAKFLIVPLELAEEHYAAHKGKPFYNGLLKYITSSPTMAMVWEGENVIMAVRQTMGATDPLQATPGSIRHDYAVGVGRNLTHASDSIVSANKEISLWFSSEEIYSWDATIDPWVFGKN